MGKPGVVTLNQGKSLPNSARRLTRVVRKLRRNNLQKPGSNKNNWSWVLNLTLQEDAIGCREKYALETDYGQEGEKSQQSKYASDEQARHIKGRQQDYIYIRFRA
jgi:hypothetical protein